MKMSFVTKPFIIRVCVDMMNMVYDEGDGKPKGIVDFIPMTEEREDMDLDELFIRMHKQYTTFFYESSSACLAAYCVKRLKFEDDNPVQNIPLIKEMVMEEENKLIKCIDDTVFKYILPEQKEEGTHHFTGFICSSDEAWPGYKKLAISIGLKEYKTKGTPSKVTLEDADEWPY